jgi:uncharacterized protein YwqG
MLKGQGAMVRLARQELPAAIADRWIGLLRPGYLLRAAGDDDPVVGQLGGIPVLPDSLAWPQSNRYGPLSFVAEIDCGQLPSGSLSLPRTGTLLFFAHSDLPTVRGMPENSAVARVLYVPGRAPVTERDPPDGTHTYDLVELTGELRSTGPALDSPVFRDAVADLGVEDRAFLDDWQAPEPFERGLWDLTPQPHHQIGGYAVPVQDAVELDVAHAQLGGKVPYTDLTVHRDALRWTLLAQFGSDQWAKMMWGDCGTLYWLIRPGDLAARKFEAASFTWQCT